MTRLRPIVFRRREVADHDGKEVEELRVKVRPHHEQVLRQHAGLSPVGGKNFTECSRGRAHERTALKAPELFVNRQIKEECRIALPPSFAVKRRFCGEGPIDLHHGLAQTIAKALVDHEIGEQVDERVLVKRNQRPLEQPEACVRLHRRRESHMVTDFVGQDRLESVAEIVLQNHLRVDCYLA